MINMNPVLVNRVKSFAWRLGVVVAVAAVNFAVKDVTNMGLSGEWVTVIGLIGGEVTKFLNDYSSPTT
ncbi:MAG TPA: hypothetical protein VF974_04920 [Patescibacteria group bacterium]